MTRLTGPFVPIYDPGKRRGQVPTGVAVGEPPPVHGTATPGAIAVSISMPAVTVTATSIPTVLLHHWDASNLASITATGSTVDQWDDLVGGQHLAPSFGTTLTGTRTLGGLNVLDFSASDLRRLTGLPNWYQDAGSDSSYSFGVLCVQDTTPGSPFISSVMYNRGATESGLRITSDKAELVTMGSLTAAAAGSVANGTWRLIVATYSGGTATLYENGSSVGSGASSGANDSTRIDFASNASIRNLDGAIAEAWVWEHGLSLAEIGVLVAYVSSKWGV